MSQRMPDDLQRLYQERFQEQREYRMGVWRAMIESFFQKFVRADAAVLDLGSGYGEFINQVRCGKKFAMDLNPDAPERVGPDVECFLQDCSATWPLPDNSLDVVFTSNFFEHLPDKAALSDTLGETLRCLKPGGRLIAIGPNIRALKGEYWDFWDHHVQLTERSMAELLTHKGFKVETCVARFLPYRMAGGPEYPFWMVKLYLKLPFVWPLWGKQFFVVARK